MVKRMLFPLSIVLPIIVALLLPAAPALAQQVEVSIVGPWFGNVTAGQQRGRTVRLQANAGQVIRFRVDPGAYWDSSRKVCWYFEKWITSWGDLFGRETDYTVRPSSNAITAAYRSTTEWWWYPECYIAGGIAPSAATPR